MKRKKHSLPWREIRDDVGLIIIPAFLLAGEQEFDISSKWILGFCALAFLTYRLMPWRHHRWQTGADADAEMFRSWVARSHAILIFILILATATTIVLQVLHTQLPKTANATLAAEVTTSRESREVKPGVAPKISYLALSIQDGNRLELTPSQLVINSVIERQIRLGRSLPPVMLLFFFVFAVALLFGEFIGGRAYRLDGAQ